MIKNYEKTIEELNEYNAENKLFIGIEDFSNEDFLLDINNVDNIAITGYAGSGKTVLLESLLYQLTSKQKTMNNLFMIDEHPGDYIYFIKKGAKVANTYLRYPDKEMPIDRVIEAAYDNFKAGNPTIFVVEQLDRIKRYTKKDLTSMLKEMIESKNAIVILVEHRISSLNKLFNIHFKMLLGLPYSDESGSCLLEDLAIKPPIVRINR